MIRVGFIGLGGMGMYQAKSFHAVTSCQVAGGADPAPAMQARFAQSYPGALLFASYEELLAHPAIDAVVVAVPTGYHQPIASAALAARKPILLEKPMARTVAQCRHLINDAERFNTLLMIAHCRRYDPYWTSWGAYVTAGKLGSPLLWRDVRAGFSPGGWFMDDEVGGGPLIDGAVHNYDFANWIFGEPESVLASAIQMNPSYSAIDTGSAIIRYRAGHQLLISWSWAVKGTTLHDIIGPQGFIQFSPGNFTVPPEEKGRYQYCCFTDSSGQQTLIQSPAQPDMYVRQAEHFLACIRGEATCQTPGTEAIKAIAVAEAVLKAGRTGTAVEIVL
ncbi:MAG: gfo/Idh/MocA family oxidoreductase [Caldilinea sp. CFX5]|nr:gfo/Idh/MocA family oxidoreductase [Caldilinea sp. CFX5]